MIQDDEGQISTNINEDLKLRVSLIKAIISLIPKERQECDHLTNPPGFIKKKQTEDNILKSISILKLALFAIYLEQPTNSTYLRCKSLLRAFNYEPTRDLTEIKTPAQMGHRFNKIFGCTFT